MKLPTINLRSALKRRNSRSGNPMQNDQDLIELLDWLDMIKSAEVFSQWQNQFLERFQDYMGETGCEQATSAYSNFQAKVERLVKAVGKLSVHIREGKISHKKISVKSRNVISEVSRDCQIINIELFGLAPATAAEENMAGYNKYHMANVLIRDNFAEFERLNFCKDVLHKFRIKVLDDIADRQVLQSMDDFDRAMNRFFSLMQDLGVHRIILKSREVHPPKIPQEIADASNGDVPTTDSNSQLTTDMIPPSPNVKQAVLDSPGGKRSLKARKLKTPPSPDSKEKTKDSSDGSRGLRKAKRSLKKLSKQDSNSSLYVEDDGDEGEKKSQSPQGIAPSIESMNQQSLTPIHSEKAIMPETQLEESDERFKVPRSVRKQTADAPVLPTSPRSVSPRERKRDGEGDNKLESTSTENPPGEQGFLKLTGTPTDTETAKSASGLVVMGAKKTRAFKKDSKRKGDDDDNRSVVSISSKKKAKLKAIQAKKGKQEIKRGMRDKKEAMKKQRQKTDTPSKVAATSKVSDDLPSSPKAFKSTIRPLSPNLSSDDNGGVETTPKSKKISSIAEFFEKGNQGVTVTEKRGARSIASEPPAIRKRDSHVDDSESNSIKLQLPNSLNSATNLKRHPTAQKFVKVLPTRTRSDPPLSKPKRRPIPSVNNHEGNSTNGTPVMTATKKKQVAPMESNAGLTNEIKPGETLDKKRATFQWPPQKPANIDDSASRLTSKWTPPRQPATKSASSKPQNVATGSQGQTSERLRPGSRTVGTKKWPSSLLDKSLGDEDAENDLEEDLILQPLDDEEEGEKDDARMQNGISGGPIRISSTTPSESLAPNQRSLEARRDRDSTVQASLSGKDDVADAVSQLKVEEQDEAEDFSFATLHKNFLIEQASPTKSPRKAMQLSSSAGPVKIPDLDLEEDADPSTVPSECVPVQASNELVEEQKNKKNISDDDNEEDYSFAKIQTAYVNSSALSNTDESITAVKEEKSLEALVEGESVEKWKTYQDDFEVVPFQATDAGGVSFADLRHSIRRSSSSQSSTSDTANESSEHLTNGRIGIRDRGTRLWKKDLNEGKVSVEPSKTPTSQPVDGSLSQSNPKEDSTSESTIKNTLSNVNPTSKETLLAKSMETPEEVPLPPAFSFLAGQKPVIKRNFSGSSRSSSTSSRSILQPRTSATSCDVENAEASQPIPPFTKSPTDNDQLPPAFRLMATSDDTTPAFKRPVSRTLAPRKPDAPAYSVNRSKPKSFEIPGSSESARPVSPTPDNTGGTVSPVCKQPQSFKLMDLVSDDDDDETGGLFFDGSTHMLSADVIRPNNTTTNTTPTSKVKDAMTKFNKPISSWASPPPDDDNRSGPRKKLNPAKKLKAPVASAKSLVGKSKVDRMKPQTADDSSVVKVKKNAPRKKGEVAYEKTVDKRKKIKPKKDTAANEAGGLTGWINPFDVAAGEHHFEIGTC